MKKLFFVFALTISQTVMSTEFESAAQAVKNIGIGWNLGNSLESNSADVDNMWIEAWSDGTPSSYETAWGQPVTTRQLIHMFAAAGFRAIRVPVTWYGHMGNMTELSKQGNGKIDINDWTGFLIDADWMERVKEVVNMVLEEGMYCIVNVHHDTGSASTAWLRADETVYAQQSQRFQAVWEQIALAFRDYDEHLLFEGYNEMLDPYSSWCFASYATTDTYDAEVASSAYSAINKYAQSFVNTVRSTGGNNAERNLIVCTYGACCGDGSWNAHLTDPLQYMELPDDSVGSGHLAFEVHSYPSFSGVSAGRAKARELVTMAQQYLAAKGAPVIFGEWGLPSDMADYIKQDFATYFVQRVKEAGMACFYWMGLSDGDDRVVPQWTDEGLKDAIVKGFYGEEGYDGISRLTADHSHETVSWYSLQGTEVKQPLSHGVYIHNGTKVLMTNH